MRLWLLACVTSAAALLVSYHTHDSVGVVAFIVLLIMAVVNVIAQVERRKP